jgi:hypothetical protein
MLEHRQHVGVSCETNNLEYHVKQTIPAANSSNNLERWCLQRTTATCWRSGQSQLNMLEHRPIASARSIMRNKQFGASCETNNLEHQPGTSTRNIGQVQWPGTVARPRTAVLAKNSMLAKTAMFAKISGVYKKQQLRIVTTIWIIG